MMKYRNRDYNEKRNGLIKDAGLAALTLGAAALGHVLAETNSAAVAVITIVCVLGALGISCLKSIRA